MQAMVVAMSADARKRANQNLVDHEIWALTEQQGGPKTVNDDNKDKLYERLVERFKDAGLDLPYENSTAFRFRCKDIAQLTRLKQIEDKCNVAVLAFSAIGYEGMTLGLVGLIGQVYSCFLSIVRTVCRR